MHPAEHFKSDNALMQEVFRAFNLKNRVNARRTPCLGRALRSLCQLGFLMKIAYVASLLAYICGVAFTGIWLPPFYGYKHSICTCLCASAEA